MIGVEAERVSDISEIVDQETTTIPAIKTEPNISCVPVVSVMHISYWLYPELPAPVSVCPCEKNVTWEWILSSFKKRSLYFVTHCMCSTTCSEMFHPSINQTLILYGCKM